MSIEPYWFNPYRLFYKGRQADFLVVTVQREDPTHAFLVYPKLPLRKEWVHGLCFPNVSVQCLVALFGNTEETNANPYTII